MRPARLVVAVVFALQGIASSGCCLFPGMYAQHAPHAVDGQRVQLAAATSSSEAAEIRGQSPERDDSR